MKQRSVFFLIIGVIVSAALFTACELIMGESGTYNLTIDLGNAFDSGGRAITTPPYDMLTYTVTVTAPDMETFQKTVSRGARFINMQVPTGRDRNIRLDANIVPAAAAGANREHLLSLADDVTVDLLPGRKVQCRFYMHAGMTKPVIPEFAQLYPGKLIRISDMTLAANWRELLQLTNSSTGGPQAVRPWEIDFDASGRIFLQDRNSATLVRINELALPAATGLFFTPAPGSLQTFAVDYLNDRVYYDSYAGLQRLFSCSLDFTGGAQVSVQPSGLSSYLSMEFDKGVLYILGTESVGSAPCLKRYIVGTGATTHTYIQTGAGDPYLPGPTDILIKGNILYVANWALGRISRFDKNTLLPLSFHGVKTTDPTENRPGFFFGPHHFIAPTNRKIYFIDETYGFGVNRIVAVDDVATWAGWESFRAEDIGEGQFVFYHC